MEASSAWVKPLSNEFSSEYTLNKKNHPRDTSDFNKFPAKGNTFGLVNQHAYDRGDAFCKPAKASK